MSILQFPQSQNPDRPVLTGGVHSQPTSDTLAAFRYEIADGLTPAEQHMAARKAIEFRLSDAAISGTSTPSMESQFKLEEQDAIDPNLWAKVQSSVLSDTAAPVSSEIIARGDVLQAEALRQYNIREYIARSGPALSNLREERLRNAA